MRRPQTSPEFHQLFLEGSLALAELEHQGMRIDKLYLDEAIVTTGKKIRRMEQELREDKDVFPVWQRTYGEKLNFGSRDQLAKVLFGEMKYSARGTTKGDRRESTSKKTLELIDQPFVKKYIKLEEFTKARSTYLVGLRRESVERDGYWWVHPSFNLNTVITMRSSSNGPNVQNQPKLNTDIAELVRRCFIARKGMYFVEPDFSQHEVRIGQIITGDKELKRYLEDPESDMHRDQSRAVFIIPEDEEVEKKAVRSWIKNDFVFATFYGSAAVNCARNLWDDIDLFNMRTISGVPMKKHLAKKGITELGDCDYKAEPGPHTFAHHVKKCQANLWRRFRGYDQWRTSMYEDYQRRGYTKTQTGFVFDGIASKNEVANLDPQGSAFHCLVWVLIRVIRKLKKYKMKSVLIAEIHDSIPSNSPPKELNDFLDICYETMVVELPKAWRWITAPLGMGVEIAPLGKSWYDLEEWVNKNGVWQPKGK
jgi:DNA polymerase I-like protein with 3'-5' exonuclease and polymerase domains